LEGKTRSTSDVKPSYPIGVAEIPVNEYFPEYIPASITEAIPDFDKWMPGYLYDGAVLTGPETRTTSPVRIERDEMGCAPGFLGIYPTGEGAGYAGGIISSAIDRIKMAEKAIEKHLK
jgi:uncharacterized FAD-dependent dehydrogenase